MRNILNDEQKKIFDIVLRSIDVFNSNEQYLISRDVSERCICAKFANYLEKSILNSQFSDYVVDVEYNRGNKGNEYAAKMLHGKNIVVDLIVHKRGYSEESGFDNLICIEMKKAYKRVDLTSDKSRLKVLTDVNCGFCYQAGFMIVAYADKKSNDYGLCIESKYFNGFEF